MIEASMTELLSAASVLVASMVLGGVKEYTAALDHRVGQVVKPLQPLLVTVAGVLVPLATDALGIADVDPARLVVAPTATVFAVTLRELAARLKRRT